MKKLRNAVAFESVDPTARVAVFTKVLSHCGQAPPRQALAPTRVCTHDVFRRPCIFCNRVLRTYRSRFPATVASVLRKVCAMPIATIDLLAHLHANVRDALGAEENSSGNRFGFAPTDGDRWNARVRRGGFSRVSRRQAARTTRRSRNPTRA